MSKKENGNPKILSSNLFPVVGIGASAGGLDAFKKLIKAIPENSGMAYIFVQHLAPSHESVLPELLQRVTTIAIHEITNNIMVKPDNIYIIPSNKILVATDGVLQLSPLPPKDQRSMPIDIFFSSLAEVHQAHAIGVVLSGTATDGTLGLKAIKDHGGITFAQDEDSAAFEGMPNSAVQAGVVDFILRPEEIPIKIAAIKNQIILSDDELQTLPPQDGEVFKQILSLLRIRRGTDFTYYKQTTIRRRILRRMAINKNEEPSAYLKYLRENKTEQDVLYQDLLIPVTSFFRDPQIFDDLCQSVFPNIEKTKPANEPIRVWVAGCSTGEEAYSIAICLKEFLGDAVHQREGPILKVQIFATDISEPAIAKARTGIYTKAEVEEISPERLNEFFTKIDGSYQLSKHIRDMCVFAVHNFLKDPPFAKVDFVSCRNVLIYMEPYLQKKALTAFHYALNPKGYLLLGKSETISSVPELFAFVGKSDKLFIRKDVPGRFMHTAMQRSEQNFREPDIAPINENIRTDFQKKADDILLSKYTPAGVVVNEAMDIVHFRGNTANYLQQAEGKPTHNLLKMAKEGLGFELRNILHKAKTDKASAIKENIPVLINDAQQYITLEAIPLRNTIEPYFLILFHKSQSSNFKPQTSNAKSSKTKKDNKDLRMQQLEQELLQLREDMRTITEEQEAANEELQSANEELLSSSEELQSLNEEMETSKEELQSTNEELTVVNQEMISLNEQVTEARNYSEAIVTNIREPLLVLDKNLRIKTANPAFYKTFRVAEAETEGVLIYALGNGQWNIPELRMLLEKILPEKSKFIDFEVRHNFSNIGERVMLLNAREIITSYKSEKLILLSIEDVTENAIARKRIEDSEKRYNKMLMQSPFAFAVLKGKDMVVTLANDSVKEMWGKGKEIEGKPLLEVLPEIKDQAFPALLNEVYTTGIPYTTYESLARLRRSGKMEDVYFNFVYQPYREIDESISGVVIIATEVTPLAEFNKKIKESEEHFRVMADLMPAKISNANMHGDVIYFNRQWLDFTGYSFEELKDFGYYKMIHPDELEEYQNRFQNAIATGTVLEMEMRFLNKDGKYKWHLNLAAPVKDKDGKIKMWVGVTTEIQTQKEQKQELEKAVGERTQSLKEANYNLGNTLQNLEQFAYVASHDLQEPLRKIQTFAYRLLGRKNEITDGDIKKDLTKITDSADRMRTLIDDLLNYSSLINHDHLFVETDLNEIIKDVLADLELLIAQKKARINFETLPVIEAVPLQMNQLFNNLIGNALKFSKEGVPPAITITTNKLNKEQRDKYQNLKKGVDYCEIVITDNGIGFNQDYADKIFTIFQRIHLPSLYAGTGIGLAICRKIVLNHDGEIYAEAKENKGAIFHVILGLSH